MRRFISGLIVLVMVSVGCGGDDAGGDEAAATQVSNSEGAGSVSAEEEALARAEAFWPALHEGRVDDLEAMSGAWDDSDRLLWEYNAILVEAFPREIHGCEVVASNELSVTVDCLLTNSDPVYIATETTELIYPFQLRGDLFHWSRFRTADGFRSPFSASEAYAEYLALFHPDEFAAACSLDAYAGDVIFNQHLALAPPCAELQVAHAHDVAAWVEAGRPAEPDA